MTDKKTRGRKLSFEILGLFAVCFIISLILYFFLLFLASGLIENLLWEQNIELNEEQQYHLDSTVFSASLVFPVFFFIILFLTLFGEKLSYIHEIIKGVDALRMGNSGYELPIVGNNELTRLAEAVNYLSKTELELKEKESRLKEEKETLIRTLSHDIRTPLTSIMSYTELLSAKGSVSDREQREYLHLVSKKTEQIKELTDILLDGGKRNVEFFEDAKLLMEQLAAEFEEALEDDYILAIDLSECKAFSGSFDVQELRRVFDNLISNIQKYADPSSPVELQIKIGSYGIIMKQKNAVLKREKQTESYQMGIYSIKRIAQNYGGGAVAEQQEDVFCITVTLSDI